MKENGVLTWDGWGHTHTQIPFNIPTEKANTSL